MSSTVNKKALKKFGQHLASLRKQKNLSLRSMSYFCDIDNSKISKIEKGEINVTFTTILELAKGLDVAPKLLFEYSPD